MNAHDGNLAVKPNADTEIRMFEGSNPSALEKVSGYLTAYNEKILGVKRKTALMAAYRDGDVIGGVCFRWYGRDALLDYVVVSEKYRGQGVGEELLVAVEKELYRQGCRQICVDTVAFQAPDFYRRMGYALVTTVPNYIGGHDQLILRKILPEGSQ